MVTFTPLGRVVLVKQLPVKTETNSGIYVGNTKDMQDYDQWLAEIVSIGPGVDTKDFPVSIGDIVMMDPTFSPIMFADPNDPNKLLMAYVKPEQLLSIVKTQKLLPTIGTQKL